MHFEHVTIHEEKYRVTIDELPISSAPLPTSRKKQRHSIYMYKLRISCVYIALYGLQNCYPNITSVVQQIKRA